jgi:hypothetical protein
MNNSCIIAPIHKPHFQTCGIEFVRSYNQYFDDEDIFLIFSSKAESDEFKSISAGSLKYGSIICDEQILPRRDRPPGQQNAAHPVTIKKIFGLKYIFNNTRFDKVGVIDVDTAFLRHIDYDKCFHEYVENKKIYATYCTQTPDVTQIIKAPLKFFNQKDKNKLRKLTHEFKAYFWFNDIPVYNKEYFLNFLKSNYEKNKSEMEYLDFDFVMYAYYLLVNNLAELEFLKINGNHIDLPYGFLETQHLVDSDEFKNIVKYYKPMWLTTDIDPQCTERVFSRLHINNSGPGLAGRAPPPK